MNLLSEMQAQLPVGQPFKLFRKTDHWGADGRQVLESIGACEVMDVNTSVGNEDAKVFVAYRHVGEKVLAEGLLTFGRGLLTYPDTLTDLCIELVVAD